MTTLIINAVHGNVAAQDNPVNECKPVSAVCERIAAIEV